MYILSTYFRITPARYYKVSTSACICLQIPTKLNRHKVSTLIHCDIIPSSPCISMIHLKPRIPPSIICLHIKSYISFIPAAHKAAMAISTTLFVNKTKDLVKLKVGNSQYSSDIASIEGGGEYKMQVNMNDTYREFLVGVGSEGKQMIVTSDDCCDYDCITIKEEGGKIDLLREPRQQMVGTTADVVADAKASKKPWFGWKIWY